jgi:hypothetical protein
MKQSERIVSSSSANFFLQRFAGRLTPCIILVLLCVGNYYNALENEFAFDDYLAIVNNKDVMYTSNNSDQSVDYTMLWKHDIWGKNIEALDSHRSYRPLLTSVFKLLVQVYGLNTKTFHITSIICHCLATLCVFKLSSIIFGRRNGVLSFGSALLFACHPVHVEAVTAVVNMAEAISLIFYITAYSIYIKSSREKNRDHTSYSHSFLQILQKLFFIGWWFIFLTISVLFKETSVTLCGVMVASSSITLLTIVRKNYLNNRKSSFKTRSMEKFKLNENKEKEQKQKTIVSILHLSIKQWLHREFLWVLASFSGLLFYSIFRIILLNPQLSPFLTSNFGAIWRNIGKSFFCFICCIFLVMDISF